MTDRFAKAVEQLGSEELNVRIGATYSLERIAKDSLKDYWTIMEVLTAFVRNKSPLPKDWKPDLKQQLADITTDVQSALTVIGRREVRHAREDEILSLQRTNLSGAILIKTNFSGAFLLLANLSGATLLLANLEGANLFNAELEGANLGGANLGGAYLRSAYIEGAHFRGANLEGARLLGTKGMVTKQIKEADNWEKAYYSPVFRQQLGLPPEEP